jgi:hypothetical protein
MNCSESSDPPLLDLSRGLPVTAADVEALRQHRPPAIADFAEYLAWLATFPATSCEELASRRGPCGEPFMLRRDERR